MSVAQRRRMKEIKRGQYDFTAQIERHKRQGRPLVTECRFWHPPKQRRHRGGEDV